MSVGNPRSSKKAACVYLGGINELTEAGPVRNCEIFGSCTETGTHAGLPSCIGCESRSTVRGRENCIYRGEELRTERGELCGMRGTTVTIRACAKHGECTAGRYCRKQTAQSCTACTDYAIEADTRPIIQRGERLKLLWICGDFAQGGISRYTTDLAKILQPMPVDIHVLFVNDFHTDRANIEAIGCPVDQYTRERYAELLAWADMVTTPGVNAWIPNHEHILSQAAGKLFGQSHGSCPYSKKLVDLTSRYTRRWFACSPAAASILPTGSEYFVPPFPIDFERITRRRPKQEAREAIGLPIDRKIIVAASRISHDKNLPGICEAVKACPSDTLLLMVGNGYAEAEFEPQMRGILQDRLIRRGWMNSPPDYLDAADAFISLSPSEGGPLTVLEAFIHGTPVVSTPVGIVPTTTVDGTQAAITHTGPDSIAEAINLKPDRLTAIRDSVTRAYSPEAVRSAWSRWFNQITVKTMAV